MVTGVINLHTMRASLLMLFLALICAASQAQQLDHSFGQDGRAVFSFKDYHKVVDMAYLSDGNTLVLANALALDGSFFDYDYVLLKLDPSGEPVLDFGTDGVVQGDFGSFESSEASGLTILEDGRILLFGRAIAKAAPTVSSGQVVALFEDGTVDASFGNSGQVTIDFHGVTEQPQQAIEDQFGRIWVVGGSVNPDDGSDMAPVVARLTFDGQLDTTFASTGMIRIESYNNAVTSVSSMKTAHISGGALYDLLPTSDSTFLLAGAIGQDEVFTSLLFHLNDDGTADTTYGEQGLRNLALLPSQNAILQLLNANGQTITQVESTESQRDFVWAEVFEDSVQVQQVTTPGHQTITEHILDAGHGQLILVARTIAQDDFSALSFSDQFTLLKTSADGQIDLDFGDNGFAHFDWGDGLQSGPKTATLTVDGKLQMAGLKYNADGTYDVAVMQVIWSEVAATAQHSSDSNFSTFWDGNRLTVTTENQEVQPWRLIDITGKILATGTTGRSAYIKGASPFGLLHLGDQVRKVMFSEFGR